MHEDKVQHLPSQQDFKYHLPCRRTRKLKNLPYFKSKNKIYKMVKFANIKGHKAVLMFLCRSIYSFYINRYLSYTDKS